MEKNEEDTSDFDLSRARKNAGVFSRATGVNCLVIDAKGTVVFETCESYCAFCTAEKAFRCADVHLYGSYQAERFGGSYTFFCPFGLTHCAAPVTNGGRIVGALILGPVMMMEPEEFMIDDFTGGLLKSGKGPAADFVRRVPVRSTESVDGMAELLRILSADIGQASDGSPQRRGDYERMRGGIAEAVRELRRRETAELTPPDYPLEKEHRLLAAISTGDRTASVKILNEILGAVFFTYGKNFEGMKARMLEIAVLLSRAAIEGGADASEIFGLNCRYLMEIDGYHTVEELTYWLSRILSRFNDCVFTLAGVRHKDVLYKAVDYIRRNYMKKLTLEEVARSVYLNPSYFSKIFKDEMGCSFVGYVNRIRVEKGKEMLLDLSVPLTDVSSTVGFDEQCYFTRVFKKMTGMTPGVYRKTRGKSTTEVQRGGAASEGR